MDRLRGIVQRYVESGDHRGLKWVRGQLRDLRGMILEGQPWFWENVLDYLKRPGRQFLNQQGAMHWLETADRAREQRNFYDLRTAVSRVWELQSPDEVERSKQQAAQSGLRGT